MKTLLFIFPLCCYLFAHKMENSAQLKSQANRSEFHSAPLESEIQVKGTMVEVFFQFKQTPNHGVTGTATNTWAGSLTGTGQNHIFRSEVVDLDKGIQKNIIGKRKLFTAEGNLYLDEIGEKNGDAVHVISTVSGGTGIYKKATGQLILEGMHTDIDIQFTYSGTIILRN